MEVDNSTQRNGKAGRPDKKKRKKYKNGTGKNEPVKKAMKISSPPELVPADSRSGSEEEQEDEPGSLEAGDHALEWMIGPIEPAEFYKSYWEQKPLLVKRSDAGYYKTVFSTKALEKIIKEQRVLYGKNLDVTSYDGGKRETHNPEGRVFPAVLWDFYNNGCSIRMLNPQTFHAGVWRLCATLHEHFQNMVGANVYLTPPGTQGFAPHWDDVEVFMLQLEGRKHWRLYGPRCEEERLPRHSSANLEQEDLGSPILETTLEPGDLLYFPRGTIHQGDCLPDQHSLHITISTYQRNSWTDLLSSLLPAALATASRRDPRYRAGLPRELLLNAGRGRAGPGRKQSEVTLRNLLHDLVDHASLDAASDLLGKQLMRDLLPPALEAGEKARTVVGDGERWHAGKSGVVNRVEVDPDTRVRLIRSTAVRLVEEEETVMAYYSTENTREYHEAEEQSIEVGLELAPALEFLIAQYPAWTKVEQLPLPELEDRMKVAGDLWEKGIVMTSRPLTAHYDDP